MFCKDHVSGAFGGMDILKTVLFQWKHLNKCYHCSDGWHDMGLLLLLDLASFEHKPRIHQSKTLACFTASIRKMLSSRKRKHSFSRASSVHTSLDTLLSLLSSVFIMHMNHHLSLDHGELGSCCISLVSSLMTVDFLGHADVTEISHVMWNFTLHQEFQHQSHTCPTCLYHLGQKRWKHRCYPSNRSVGTSVSFQYSPRTSAGHTSPANFSPVVMMDTWATVFAFWAQIIGGSNQFHLLGFDSWLLKPALRLHLVTGRGTNTSEKAMT